ncbi:MAG: hypothetical protein CV090_15760, partial [Nitrospira sp. WS238]|nr:hypothetical protein [Nitrospira sp. WS238]
GITVKMDMLSKAGDKRIRMTSELTNLKLEKQDPALFEIPAGYTKNDMGALMGGAGMPNLEELRKNAEQRRANQKQPRENPNGGNGTGRDLPVDVNQMMKGLFGK